MPTQTLPKRKLYRSTPRRLILGVLLGVLGFVILTGVQPHKTFAATNSTINFQAKLMTAAGAIAADGYYDVQFNLYTGLTGGTSAWTETRDYNSNSPDNRVRVVNGYLTVNLGSVTAFPSTINWDQNLYLGMTVRGTGTCSFAACTPADAEMSPRLALTATPYAFAAGKLSTLNGANTSTLTIQGSSSNVQNFVIPDQGAAGTYNLLTTAAANSGYIQLQGTTPGTAQTGNFNITGTGIASNIQAPLFQTADVSGASTSSAAITFRSGNSATSGNTGTVTISSGNASSGNSGNINIDSGSATGTFGSINIGTTNAAAINLGSGTNAINANSSVTVAAGKTVNLTGGNTASRPASPTEGMVYYDTTTKQLIVYSNGKWQADRNSSTKIVAASNASQAEKDGADYVATGTADQTIINTALTAAAGGKVYLTEGTFTTTDAISIPNDTTLAGAGRGTLIQFANIAGQTKNMITNSDTTTGAGVTVRDLQLDGLKATNTTGTQNGIYMNGVGGSAGASARQGVTITNIWANNFNNYGINVLSGANSTITGSTAQGNTADGFRINSNNRSSVTGNIAQGNTGYGFYFTGQLYSILSDNIVSGNTNGGIAIIGSSTFNTIDGNNLRDNGGTGGNHSIQINTSSSNNTISNNVINDTAGTGYAINIADAGSTSNYLNDNTYSGTGATAINDNGTNTIYGGQLSNTSGYLVQPSAAITLNAAGASSLTTTSGGLTIDTLTTAGQTIAIGNGALSHTIAIGTGAAVQGITIGSTNSTSSTLIQSGTGNLQIQTQGGSGTLGIGNNAVAQTLAIGNSTGATSVTVNAGSGGINIGTSGTANTIQIGNTSGAVTQTINVGNNATASSTTNVVVGSTIAGTTSLQSNGGVTVSKGLTIGTGAGTGSFTNNGSTVNTVLNISNSTGVFGTGTAAGTVDIYTGFTITAGAASLTYTPPTPTASTTYGRLIYVTNIGGTNTFTLINSPIRPGATATLVWANVNGVGTWTFAGADNTSILNQTGQQTSANFNIDGTGTAGGFLVTAGNNALDTATAGTLLLGNANASTISIANNNANHTINIATGTGNQTVTIGSLSGTSSTTLQGGTGGIALNVASGGAYSFTQGGVNVFNIDTAGRLIVKPNTTSGQFFTSQDSGGNALFYTSSTGAVIPTGSALTLNAGSAFTSNTALNINTTTSVNFATPLGVNLGADVAIQSRTYSGFGIAFAAGLSSSSSNTSRGIMVADARATTNNQPAIGVLSPDENNIFGLVWDGSSTTAKLKAADQTQNGNNGINIYVAAGAGNGAGAGGEARLVGGAGGASNGAAGIASVIGGSATSGNINGGNVNIDGGLKNGTGINGAVNVGISNASAVNIGSSGATTTIGGGTVFTPSTGYSSGTSSTITASLLTNGTAVPVTATAASLTFTMPTSGIGAAGRVVYITNAGSNNFSLVTGSGTLTVTTISAATLYWNGTTWLSAGLDSGATSVGTFGGSIANGLSITNNILTLGAADATNPGGVSIVGQNFLGTKTFNTGVTVGNAAGSGALVNNGTTQNTVSAQSYGTSSSITGVDTYTAFAITATAGSATITIPSPASGAGAAGKLIYVSNAGSNAFTMLSATMNPGVTASLFWNGTAWTFAGADANSIINQSATPGTAQSANFNINGTGIASTLQATSFTSTSNLSIQAASGNNITISPGAAGGGSGILNLAVNAATLNIGNNSNNARTIAIGNTGGSQSQTVTIGNIGDGTAGNGASVTTLQGGTAAAAITLVTGNNGATAGGINIGNTTGAFTQAINIGTNATASSTTNITIGSTVAGSTTLQSAGGVTVSKTLTLGASAGNGAFVNNGTTLNTVSAQSYGANSSITGVDTYSAFSITATAAGLTITVPNPANTTAGKLIYLSNVGGTNAFTLLGSTMNTGVTATLFWNGSVWTFAGSDGSSILNQTATPGTAQTGNFNINGTGIAATLQAATFDTASSVALNLAQSSASAINIGKTTTTATIYGSTTLGQTAGTGILINNGATRNTTTTQTTALSVNVANIDNYTSFVLTATATGLTYTLPDPATTTAGKLIYVGNASSGSNTFTLTATHGSPVLLNPGSTTTLLWNGAAWTYAGADSSGLQAAYNNSAGTTTPEIILDSTRAGFDIQDASTTPLTGTPPLLAVRGSATATTLGTALFTVANNANAPLVGIGINVATRALDVAVNNTAVTQPQVLIEQANAAGDAGIEFKNTATGTSFFVGQDTSNNSAYTISSGSASASSPSTIAFVQSPTPLTNAASSSSIGPLAFGTANTAGNTIVAAAGWDGQFGVTGSCSDTKGNTYTTQILKLESGGADYMLVCTATNIAAGANSVTVNLTGAASGRLLSIHEYSGVKSATPLDITSTNVGGTTNTSTGGLTSGSATTSQNGDLIFGFAFDTSAATTTITADTGAGFAIRSSVANALSFATEDRTQSAAAPTAATFTASLAGHSYGAAMVALKAVTTQGDTFSTPLFQLSQSGAATFRNFANSTNALSIQNSTAATNIFNVDTLNGRVGINLPTGSTATGDLSFGTGDRTINILNPTAANTTGGALSLASASGTGTGAGGAVNIQGGAGGSTSGAGGNVNISAGNATAGNSAGGNLVLTAGTATGTGTAGTITARVTSDSTSAFSVQNSVGASMFSVDTTQTAGTSSANLAVNGGAETGTTTPTSWAQVGTPSSFTRTTTANTYVSGSAATQVTTTTTTGQGVKNNLGAALSNTGSQQYVVTFSVKAGAAGTAITNANLRVQYLRDGTTNDSSCAAASLNSAYLAAINTSSFVKLTCTLTPSTTAGNTSAAIAIVDADAAIHQLYIDNFSVVAQSSAANSQNTGAIRIGGAAGQGLTLFQLDTYAGTPFTGANPALAGAMYFDTTAGKMQCYDGSVWGACGAAPNSIITLTPEYAGAVLNGTGIGTMTSDFCANQTSISFTVGSLCSTGEARNFYKWTSPQGSAQAYNMYITYKLPGTFKQFISGSTSLTGLVDNTTNASVKLTIYKKASSGGLTACSPIATVIGGGSGTVNTWTTGVAGNGTSLPSSVDPSGCGFTANDSVIFVITVSSLSNANAYAENLNFTYSNQ